MADPTTTHHATCYREHHACAVARLDRLREAMEGMPPGPWSLPSFDHDDMCTTFSVLGSDHRVADVPEGAVVDLLVAVRDITEGR